MSGRPSGNSAALRREARRRRILENSEERLRSITGKSVPVQSEARQESRSRFLYDFQNPEVNEMLRELRDTLSPELAAEIDFLTHRPDINDVRDDSMKMKTGSESNGSGSTWMGTLIQKRFHFIILAVIVQILYILNLGHLFYNNLFFPFITVKLMEFCLLHEPYKMDNQEGLDMLSAVFNMSMARNMLRASYVFAVIASDFCLYIFVFVASDKLLSATISSYAAN